MFESHLAGNSLEGDENPGNTSDDWMVEAVRSAGGTVHNLVGSGIQEMTGAPVSPLSSPQSAQIPGSVINTVPGQVPPYMLQATNPNALATAALPPPPSAGPSKLLIYGGLGAAALVGYLWYTGKIGGRKRRRR